MEHTEPKNVNGAAAGYEIDDISYINRLNHKAAGTWQQYDVLLEARGYGWETMLDWAAYMDDADLEAISTVRAGDLGKGESELIDQYRKCDSDLKRMPELEAEKSILSIGGMSLVLHAPVKIVWFNQTRTLRLFTLIDDEELMRRYIETMIRRTFGTGQEMCLARPVPEA